MKENIISISYIFIAFALVYVINIILGFVQNVIIKREDFDLKKLLQSIIKLAVYYIAMIGIVAAFEFMSTALLRYEIEISQQLSDTLSVLAFALLYASAFYKYAKQVYDKIKIGFDITDDDIIAAVKKETDQIQDNKKKDETVVKPEQSEKDKEPHIYYCSYIQNKGWLDWVGDGEVSGTEGQSLRLEAVSVWLKNTDGGLECCAHVQDNGWMNWVRDGVVAGTEEQSKRLEALKMRLTGAAADLYDIYYCLHVEDFGWMGWAKNGDPAGSTGYGRRAEAFKAVLVKKGDPAPGSTENAYAENLTPPQPQIKFRMPVNYIGISYPFSASHLGVDFGYDNNPNMPIYAATNGIVQAAENSGGAGNYVKIRFDDGVNSWYTYSKHLSRIDVAEGQTVTIGQQIGLMGDTGDADGYHLHFDLVKMPLGQYYNNANAGQRAQYSVNPLDYLVVDNGQIVGNVTAQKYKLKYA